MDTLGVMACQWRAGLRSVTGLLVGTLVAACGEAATTPNVSIGPIASASASAESTASATAGVPSPTAPVAASATAHSNTPRPTELALDSLAVTIADNVVVRSKPEVSTASIIYKPSLPRGTQLHVIAGPVEASGYRWYDVEPLTFALNNDLKRGYIAVAARDGTPWVVRAEGALAPDPAWQRVADQAVFADAYMVAIAAGPDRYVAVGCPATGVVGDACIAAVSWTSTDGRSWRRSMIDQEGNVDQVIAGAGFLAWGHGPDGPLIWSSPDGVSWRRAPTISSFAETTMSSVVWLGDRYLAAGSSTKHQFLVWSSFDGLAWQLLADTACSEPDDGWPSGTDASWLAPVLAPRWVSTGAGPRLIASVASVTAAFGDPRAHSLAGSSVDGRCWSWTANAPSDGGIDLILTADGRLAALGTRLDGELGPSSPAAWTSTDGIRWVAAAVPSDSRWWGGPVVTADDRGLIALGDGGSLPVVWRSADGTAWTKASPPDAARDGLPRCDIVDGPCPLRTRVAGVTHGVSGLVAVGVTERPGGTHVGVVWIAP